MPLSQVPSDAVDSAAENSTPVNSDASLAVSAIARRAFYPYLARGREDGHDVDDWLQAERELQGNTKAAA